MWSCPYTYCPDRPDSLFVARAFSAGASGVYTAFIQYMPDISADADIRVALVDSGPCEPLQACCFPDGLCQNLPLWDCSVGGGLPQGAGSSCGGVACPDLGQPFVVASASTDTSLYVNGEGIVRFTIVTRSNWGNSPNVHLSVDLEPSLGPLMHVGDDEFPLLPGDTHVSQFSWPVPDSSYSVEFDGHMALTTDAPASSSIILFSRRAWFRSNPLATAIVQQYQGQALNCWSEQTECWLRGLKFFPVAGTIASISIALNDFCQMGAFADRGDEGGVIGAFWAGRRS